MYICNHMVVVTILYDILNPVRLVFSSLAFTIRFAIKNLHIESHTVCMLVTKLQKKKPAQTIKETSRYVRLECVNKRHNCMLAR